MINSKIKDRVCLSVGAALLSCVVGYGFASEADSSSVFSSEGTYVSQNGQCTAELKRNAERGGTDLSLFGKSHELISSIDDVNGISWQQNVLYFSASPVYGKPGMFAFDCETTKLRTLVKPRNKDRGYPDGADYFELSAIKSSSIEYFYYPDVDKLPSRDQLKKKLLRLK